MLFLGGKVAKIGPRLADIHSSDSVLGCVCLTFGFDPERGKESQLLSTNVLVPLRAQDFVE